jgi:hypothetical protein
MLIRVTGPNFVGGFIFSDRGKVIEAAPILKWAEGMTADEVRAEVTKRGFKAAIVRTLTGAEIKAVGEVRIRSRPPARSR